MKKLVCIAAAWLASPAQAAPLQHTVVKGDHLWALAGQYYNNHFRWKVIYSANQGKIKDPHWIYPGQVIEIPDVPGPEIGEVGARPIETGAAVAKTPEPAPEPPAAAPAPAPAPEPAPAPRLEGAPIRKDDLSAETPPSMTGQYPSMTRVKPPKDWSSDGEVVDFDGREILAAQGDTINAKLEKGETAYVGERFLIYRKDAPQETDDDQKALYLQAVGEVEVVKAQKGSSYTFRVLKSGDSLQVGDLLKREGK